MVCLNVRGLGASQRKAPEIEALMKPAVAAAILTDTGLPDGSSGLRISWRQHKYLHFLHEGDAGPNAGVGLLVNTALVEAEQLRKTQNAVPNAVGWWRLTGCGVDVVVAGVYLAPRYRQSGREDGTDLEEHIYHELLQGLQAHSTARVLILGDFNAHIARHEGGEHDRRGHSDGTNAAGRRLLRFLTQSDMYVLNGAATPTVTYTRAQPTYRAGGWRLQGDSEQRATTLVDYALASADTAAHCIRDVHVQGTDVDTDHRAVVVTLGGARRDQLRAAQRRMRKHLCERLAPREPGVTSRLWRDYGKRVGQALKAQRHRFCEGQCDWDTALAPVTRQLRRDELCEMYSFIVKVMRSQYRRLLLDFRTSQRRDLDRRQNRVWRARRRRRNAQRYLQRVLQRQYGAAAQGVARQRVEQAQAQLRMASASQAYAERNQVHQVLVDALKAPTSTRRNQKFAHVILMACSAEGPRHSAGRSAHVRPLNTPHGGVAETPAEQVEVFTDHLCTVYRATINRPAGDRDGLQLSCRAEPALHEDGPITTSEVIESLKSLRFHKGGGTDKVSSNMLKRSWVRTCQRRGPGSTEAATWLAAFFNECRRQAWFPPELLQGEATMLAKPGKDHALPTAYRSITVLNAIRKLFEEIHTKRVLAVAEEHHRLGETQAAYRPGRCCADNLFVLTTLMRARKVPRVVATQAGALVRPMNGVPDPAGIMASVHGGITGGPHVIALDLATAFDRAAWPWVFGRLQAAGVGDATTQALQAMYRGSKFRVKVDGTTGPWMYPSRGVLQGGITSPLLFVLYMAQIVAEVRRCVEQGYVDMAQPLQPNAWPTVTGNPGSPRTVQCGPLTLLLYADDLLIVAQNKDHLDLAMRAATKAVHLMGGKFNRAKTRHLVTSLSAVSQRWYEVNTAGELEVTGECPKATRLSKQTGDAYLGTTVTHTADMRPQALAAHKATRANLSRVGSIASTYGRHDPGITKIVLHQAYSYLLFGAEVWATKHDALHNGTLQAVAHTAARALDLPRRTSRAFLLGELGLRAPRTALFGAKIMYWAELLIQPDHRFQRHCYKMDLATFVAGEARGDRWPTWCSELHAMLQHISTTIQRLPPGARPASVRWLLDGWADADVAAQHEQLTLAVQRMGLPSLPARCDLHNVEAYCAARRTVRQLASRAVSDWEELMWRAEMEQQHSLRFYRRLHSKRECALRLRRAADVRATKLVTRLRANVYPLAETTAHTHHRDHGVEYVRAARCPLCDTGAAEDLEHFLLQCPALQAVRGDLTRKFLGVCRSTAVRSRLQDPRPRRRTAALLHAMLGGDMRELGLETWTLLRRNPPDGTSTHPALDSTAAHKLASREVKALVELREKLLARVRPV